MKSWLQDENIKVYLTEKEGKSVVTERLIRTFKNKTYEHMTAISKNVSINKLPGLEKNATILFIGLSKWNLLILNVIHFTNFDVEFNTKEVNTMLWSYKSIKIQ